MPEIMTAPAPAVSAPAPVPVAAPVATPAPAPSTPSPIAGLFDSQAFPTPKTETTAPTETPKPTDPPKLFAGRFKTPEELEIAYKESGTEAYRLFQESRHNAQVIAELKARLVEVEASRNAPTFKELSKEQLDKLFAEDPLKAAEYLTDKKFFERDQAQNQEKTKAQRLETEKVKAQTEQFILQRGKELSENVDKYPHYNDLISEMETFAKKVGPDLQSKAWAPDFLYFFGLGRMYYQSLMKGKSATSEASKKTAESASASAAASSPPNPSPTKVEGKVDEDSDEAVMNRIIKAGSPMLFKV